MNKISNFKSFLINEEYSKNTPIPELINNEEKLGIILLGLPGSGKSTFAKDIIFKYQKNIKIFSTDDVSYKFTKDPNIYHKKSSKININYLNNYIKTGQNYVYDTTGVSRHNVFKIFNKSRENGYKVIFILILVDIESAKNQNINRYKSGGHKVDKEFIEYVYSEQLSTTKEFLNLNPDSFYIVNNKSGKYKYYKHTGNEILKRKVNKYIPIK